MKKIFLILLFCTFSILPVKTDYSFRAQLHEHACQDDGFKKKIREKMHDGTVEWHREVQSPTKCAKNNESLSPLSPYDDHSKYLLQAYKNGNKLTPTERNMVIAYLQQQINLINFSYEIGHSQHTTFIWRMLGYATLSCRRYARDLIHKHSEWQKDLNELTNNEFIEETTYIFS